MRRTLRFLILAVGIGVVASAGTAQPPRGKPADPSRAAPKGDGGSSASFVDNFVARMMAFDKNKDGKLTKDEITDERLLRLFDQADADKDGVVTKEELVALATKLAAEQGQGGGGQPGGPPGGPGGRGAGGPGGRGPGGGPPQPGTVLPTPLQDRLNLTADQKKQLDELQKEVDTKLGKILTDDQKKQLKEMGDRGPGGFGPKPGGDGQRPSKPGKPGKPGEGERPPRPESEPPPPPPAKPESKEEAKNDPTRGGIQWYATWERGLKEAQRTGRPILLVSAAPHCAGVSGIW